MFAITAGAFVPLNFMAVRAATSLVHPRTLSSTQNLPGPMALTFLVSLAAMVALWVTLWKYELASKHASIQLAALRRRLAGDDEALLAVGRSAAPQEL